MISDPKWKEPVSDVGSVKEFTAAGLVPTRTRVSKSVLDQIETWVNECILGSIGGRGAKVLS